MSYKISIIVPVYNTELYLPTCIDSILNQSYKNIEVILANDGSSDNSEKIIQTYANKDSRIKILNQTNQGASITRYNALQIATGNYVSFVDSDDWIENNCIEKALTEIIKNNAEICVFDYETNNIPGGNWSYGVFDNHALLDEYYNKKIHNKQCNKVIKINLIRNAKFPHNRDLKEDACIMAQVLSHTNRLVRIPDILYHYRPVATSLTHKKNRPIIEWVGAYRNELDKLLILWEHLPARRPEILKDIGAIYTELMIKNYNFKLYQFDSILLNFTSKYKEDILYISANYRRSIDINLILYFTKNKSFVSLRRRFILLSLNPYYSNFIIRITRIIKNRLLNKNNKVPL